MLYVIRHGETDWNAQGRFQGRQDIPLNPVGHRQAHGNAARLARVITDARDWTFYTSPLRRTLQTMEPIAQALGLSMDTVTRDERLMELSYGIFEGQTIEEIERGVDDALASQAAARNTDKWGFAPPGGESYAMLTKRVGDWLNTVSGDAVVVTHGGVMRALLTLLTPMDTHTASRFHTLQDNVLVFRDGFANWLD